MHNGASAGNHPKNAYNVCLYNDFFTLRVKKYLIFSMKVINKN